MMANLRGLAFLRAALQREPTQEELDYICRECNCEIEDLNRESRIILLARVFHSGIFALGNWIGKNSCAVKAVRYHVTEISNEQFIEFSTEFVVDPHQSFSLHTISSPRKHNQRAPSYFWHNIGNATADWWDYVVKSKIITASYDNANSESSRGRVILEQYQPGDTIIAFASGSGAVGVGEIPATSHYEYKEHDLKAYEDSHYHRRGINWLGVLPLASAVKSNEIRSIGLNWPTQTKQEFLQDPKLAIQLRDLILAKVSKSQKKTA